MGFTAFTGQARIALDTGEDAVYFDNPDLPATRSEMAIPLRAGGQVIGVLDVQSEQVNAFQPGRHRAADSIMADQVSIAIQNAQQFQATQRAAAEAAGSPTRRYIRGEWRTLRAKPGEWDTATRKPASGRSRRAVQSLEIEEAEATGLTRVSTNEANKPLVVPIKLREEVLGVLNISASGGRRCDPDEVDIIEAVAERVALAVENVRLLETSRAQAAREQTISAVSARIGSSVNLQSILQTAVEEARDASCPGSEVVIRDSERSAPTNESHAMNEPFKPLFLFADPEDTSYLRLLRGILTIAGVGLLVLMAALRLTQPETPRRCSSWQSWKPPFCSRSCC